jgi:putative ABC transport system substrate-binding protein
LSSPLVFISFSLKQTGELALANRLPLILLFAESPKDGLIAYEPDIAAFFEKAEVKF